ncbi:MAG TPA: hypothetical protein VKC60_16415 [Opitutaceae bacterium]|nr:hypothetical protein [Opitutaceae bacterium]
MSAEFGWWSRDTEDRRLQIRVEVFGVAITWKCKQGHHQPWLSYTPTPEDWDHLNAEADKRIPRRIISEKIVAAIRRRGEK